MFKKILLTFVLVVALSACGATNTKNKTADVLDENTSLEDLKGAPTVILFGGTYCPHCTKSIPTFEELIWTPYNQKANLWVNVIDKKRFDNDVIAQGYNANLKYNDITGEECNFVPSWVLLDKKGQVAESSCGSKKGIEDMAAELAKLVK